MSQRDLLEAIAYMNYHALLYEHNQYLEDIGMFRGVWREDFDVAVKRHLAGNPLLREFLSRLEWGGEWVEVARRHAATLDGTENVDYLAAIKQKAAASKTSDGGLNDNE